MIYVVLGFPVSLGSYKIFNIGMLWLRRKFHFTNGSDDIKGTIDWYFFILLTFILFGIFVLIPVAYFGYLLYFFVKIISNIHFSIIHIIVFSILQVIVLNCREILFANFFRLYKREVSEHIRLEANQHIDDVQIIAKFKITYLILFDFLVFPIASFIIADFFAGLF